MSARIERYLVLAREVGVRPVIVLTKADLSPGAGRFLEAARALQPRLEVKLVNGRDPKSVAGLAALLWHRGDSCAGGIIRCRQVNSRQHV